MSKSWDNNILKKLKALVGKGLSTAEIGKKLGMSKNAVVGKLHRMGWNGGMTESVPAGKKQAVAKKSGTNKKVAPVKKVATAKPLRSAKTDKDSKKKTAGVKETSKVAKPAKVAVSSPKTVGGGRGGAAVHQRIVQHALEMANLKPNQCRWPIGDPDSEGFHFCGQTVFVGKPYCYEHCKQAYQFVPPKKK